MTEATIESGLFSNRAETNRFSISLRGLDDPQQNSDIDGRLGNSEKGKEKPPQKTKTECEIREKR